MATTGGGGSACIWGGAGGLHNSATTVPARRAHRPAAQGACLSPPRSLLGRDRYAASAGGGSTNFINESSNCAKGALTS